MRPTAPKVAKRSKSGPHAAKLNLSPYKTRTGGTLVCTAKTGENAPRGPVGRFTGILNTGKETETWNTLTPSKPCAA